MNNRQYLTIKQTQRLQNERIDLSGASALWLKLDGEKPQAVSKEFAEFFFLKESIEDYTLAPALSLSDIMETSFAGRDKDVEQSPVSAYSARGND